MTHPNLGIKIFADGADLDGIKAMYAQPWVRGFTTNPTLMRKSGIADYKAFAQQVLAVVPDRPVSFEVFADDFPTMAGQAREIASWGANVNVKIPVTDTKGVFAGDLIGELAKQRVVLNVTAVFTLEQVADIAERLHPDVPAIVSIFAGRIADTGLDPVPLMSAAKAILSRRPKAELLWASPRELLNIVQADQIGCDIITVTNDLLSKLPLLGKSLNEYSRETVQMFYRDATAAGFSVPTRDLQAA